MIQKGTKITELERDVFTRVLRGEDPWGGIHDVGSRRCSAALGRLQRRGYIERGYIPGGDGTVGWYVTDAGKQMWGAPA